MARRSLLAVLTVVMALMASAGAATVTVTQVVPIGSGTQDVTYSLTSYGTTDWQLLSGGTVSPTDEMNGGSGIGALSYDAGTGTPGLTSTVTGKTPLYEWTNGTSTAVRSASGANVLGTVNDTVNIGQTFTLLVNATDASSEMYLWLLGENVNLDITGTVTGATDTFSAGAGGNSPFLGLFKVDFEADNPSDTLTLTIEKTGILGGTNSRFGVQALALSVVPEPTTLALLALGGVALLRRRKR